MSTMFAAIPSLPRAELAHLTQRMIDRMDEIDGDPDCEITGEDDEPEHDLDVAGDDGCGVILRDGKRRWGSEKDDPGDVIPIYGVDQTREPIGHRPAPAYGWKEDHHD